MENIESPIKLKTREKIFGCIFLPVHIFLLPIVLGLMGDWLYAKGIISSFYQLNTVWYIISFIAVFLIFHDYLKSSFEYLLSNKGAAVKAVLLGFILKYVLDLFIYILLGASLGQTSVAYEEEAVQFTREMLNITIACCVLLQPLAEETLFRGLVFSWIGEKRRTLSYILSALLFILCQTWQYLLLDISVTDFVVLVASLVPSTVAFTWAYEKSGTIWASVFLRMISGAIEAYSLYLIYFGMPYLIT